MLFLLAMLLTLGLGHSEVKLLTLGQGLVKLLTLGQGEVKLLTGRE